MKQLKLPFDGGPARPPPTATTLNLILTRLARIESRLVQLMKHEGMKHDGRSALPDHTDSLKD